MRYSAVNRKVLYNGCVAGWMSHSLVKVKWYYYDRHHQNVTVRCLDAGHHHRSCSSFVLAHFNVCAVSKVGKLHLAKVSLSICKIGSCNLRPR